MSFAELRSRMGAAWSTEPASKSMTAGRPLTETPMSRRGFAKLLGAIAFASQCPPDGCKVNLPYVASETEWSKERDNFAASASELLSEISGHNVAIEVDDAIEKFSKDERGRIFAGLYLGWQQQAQALEMLKSKQPGVDFVTNNPCRVSDVVRVKYGTDDGSYASTDHEIDSEQITKTTLSFGVWNSDPDNPNNEDNDYRAFAAIHESAHATEGYDIDDKIISQGYDFSVARSVREAHATIITAQTLNYIQNNYNEVSSNPLTTRAVDALTFKDLELDFVSSHNHREYIGNIAKSSYLAGKSMSVWDSAPNGHLRMHIQTMFADKAGAFSEQNLTTDALYHRSQLVHNVIDTSDSSLMRTANTFANLINVGVLPGKNYIATSDTAECVTVAPEKVELGDGNTAMMVEHVTFLGGGNEPQAETLKTPIKAVLVDGKNKKHSVSIAQNNDWGGPFARWEVVFDDYINPSTGQTLELYDKDDKLIYTLACCGKGEQLFSRGGLIRPYLRADYLQRWAGTRPAPTE